MNPKDTFSAARQEHKRHRWLQVLLAFSLFISINSWSAFHFRQWDLTLDQKHTLSCETQECLRQLKAPIEVWVTLLPNPENIHLAQAHLDLARLLAQYTYVANADRGHEEPHFKAEFINIFKQKKRATWLAERYALKQENTILIASGDQYREIALSDLYEVKDNRLVNFKAEALLTSAIYQITQQKPTQIYYTTGHGELDPQSPHPLQGCSELAQTLRMQYYTLVPLELSLTNDVPKDADAVLIMGPKTPFLAHEIQAIRHYLKEQQGTVMLCAPAMKPLEGLDTLAGEWGMQLDNKIVIDVGTEFQASTGDCILNKLATHPITQPLINYNVGLLMGLMRPIEQRAFEGNLSQRTLQLTPLLMSSASSWSKETSSISTTGADFDPLNDSQGPLPVAMLAEHVVDVPAFISLKSGRLLVIGNSDFLSNHKLNALGNKLFVLSALSYLTQKMQHIPISAQPLEHFKLVLKADETKNLSLYLASVPLGLGLISGVYLRYRKQRYG